MAGIKLINNLKALISVRIPLEAIPTNGNLIVKLMIGKIIIVTALVIIMIIIINTSNIIVLMIII